MYTTCLHCHGPLGANEVVEHFPVGSRLAYDAAKGRLWVVCARCQRWNLTPLEERWEAIEECEREFERTSMRASTDNIVLARTRSGLDLVRVGAPSYPEFAAWRYGRILTERWKRSAIPGGIFMAGVWTMQIVTTTELLPFAVGFGAMAAVGGAVALKFRREMQAKVLLPDGRLATVEHLMPGKVQLERDGEDAWAVRLTHKAGTARATGPDAVHAMRGVLTAANATGGRRRDIADATSLLANLGGKRGVAQIAAVAEKHADGNVNFLPKEVRLALEMALHEDSERAAMEGELDALRDEWRKSEEIARIADEMFLPDRITSQLSRLKSKMGLA